MAPVAAAAVRAAGPRPSTSAPSARALFSTPPPSGRAPRTPLPGGVRAGAGRPVSRRRSQTTITTASAADPRNRTRLATRLVTLPRRVDIYFEGQPVRRILWTAIAFAVGFYAANTVSLSFGALSVNDVVAAALTVAFYEGVTAIYHRASRKTLRLLFLNSFKVGVVVALIADAFKLAG